LTRNILGKGRELKISQGPKEKPKLRGQQGLGILLSKVSRVVLKGGKNEETRKGRNPVADQDRNAALSRQKLKKRDERRYRVGGPTEPCI